jgi:hypothetical protein
VCTKDRAIDAVLIAVSARFMRSIVEFARPLLIDRHP